SSEPGDRSHNIAVGDKAGQNVEGQFNLALGSQSGEGVSGDNNIALGRSAGASQRGDANINIGVGANNSLTDDEGDINQAISIGQNAHGTGSRGVSIGYNASAGREGVALGSTASAVGSGIAIGNGARVENGGFIALGSGAVSRQSDLEDDEGNIELSYLTKREASYAVSVGNDTAQRRITNVADGAK